MNIRVKLLEAQVDTLKTTLEQQFEINQGSVNLFKDLTKKIFELELRIAKLENE